MGKSEMVKERSVPLSWGNDVGGELRATASWRHGCCLSYAYCIRCHDY